MGSATSTDQDPDQHLPGSDSNPQYPTPGIGTDVESSEVNGHSNGDDGRNISADIESPKGKNGKKTKKNRLKKEKKPSPDLRNTDNSKPYEELKFSDSKNDGYSTCLPAKEEIYSQANHGPPRNPLNAIQLKALCDYFGQNSSDLDYRKGNLMTQIEAKNDVGYFFVEQPSNGRRGYIHESRVVAVDRFETQPWFHYFNRQEAEEKLRQQGNEEGTYLIRPSKEGSYALSVLIMEGGVNHYTTNVGSDGKCSIEYTGGESRPFECIPSLLIHLTEVQDLPVRLVKPYPKD